MLQAFDDLKITILKAQYFEFENERAMLMPNITILQQIPALDSDNITLEKLS